MKIQKKRLILPELEVIEELAKSTPEILITDDSVFCTFETYNLICKHTDLGRRPWLWDAQDDMVKAFFTIDVNDQTTLYIEFDDLAENGGTGEAEITLTADQAKEIIAHTIQGIDLDKHGELKIEKFVGVDRDGAPETEMVAISLYDLIESDLIGFAEASRCYLYHLHLTQQKTQRADGRRFPWEILPAAEAA
jgi:hypothetical protein